MFWNVERWTLEKFSGVTAFVYADIAYWCMQGKPYGAGQEHIASKLHCSVRSVKTAIQKLTAGGWIEKHAAGKRKERNEYSLNYGLVRQAAEEWKRETAGKMPDAVPDSVTVHDWMIQHFGHGVKCLIIANLYQIQSAETAAADAVRMMCGQFDGFTRGQAALCAQCACKKRDLIYALNELQAAGFVYSECLEIKVKQSRTVYYLDVENLQRCKNCTCKADEGAKTALVKPDEGAKTAPNDYNNYDFNVFYDCSAQSAPFAPAAIVENPCTAETEETKPDEQSEQEQARPAAMSIDAFMKQMQTETETEPETEPETDLKQTETEKAIRAKAAEGKLTIADANAAIFDLWGKL